MKTSNGMIMSPGHPLSVKALAAIPGVSNARKTGGLRKPRRFEFSFQGQPIALEEAKPSYFDEQRAGLHGFVDHLLSMFDPDQGFHDSMHKLVDDIRAGYAIHMDFEFEPGDDTFNVLLAAAEATGGLLFAFDSFTLPGSGSILGVLAIRDAMIQDGMTPEEADARLAGGADGEDDTDVPGESKPLSDEEREAFRKAREDALTEKQRARAARVKAMLDARQVPQLPYPLCVEDEDQVKLQSTEDAVRRMMILWFIDQRAEDVTPREEVLAGIDRFGLRSFLSPNEAEFLQRTDRDEEECQGLVWRLEAIWVLFWALGVIDELPWPSGMCDVKTLIPRLIDFTKHPEKLQTLELRPAAEILDAQELTMKIHWALRDAWINKCPIPEDLDWAGDAPRIPPAPTAAGAVVEQRHYVLNWLANFMEPATWDDVDTPT